MHEDFEMIQHFACQIIKAALNRNLVDADHYHAKMDRKIEEMWKRTGQDRNNCCDVFLYPDEGCPECGRIG